jgi:hypothetical protein
VNLEIPWLIPAVLAWILLFLLWLWYGSTFAGAIKKSHAELWARINKPEGLGILRSKSKTAEMSFNRYILNGDWTELSETLRGKAGVSRIILTLVVLGFIFILTVALGNYFWWKG